MSTTSANRWEALTVAVVAKECRPGRVKTRLCPPLRHEEAAELAAVSLRQTLQTVRALPVRHRVLFFAGTPEPVDAEGMTVVSQPDGGLDERLAALCMQVTGPLLIVGMDTPQLTASMLAPMRADWERPAPLADAWFGPAADGGFWALALAAPDPDLIRGVPMSVESTGAVQRERLVTAGLRVGDLGVLRDVDVIDDAIEVARLCPSTAFADACARLGLPANPEPAGETGATGRDGGR